MGTTTAAADGEPHGEGIPWWFGDRRPTRARRSGLTRVRIVDAALALIDREGFDALSMRRLAAELGSGVMSLYWYVENRDELVALIVDELLADFPTPAPDTPWRDQIMAVARNLDAILRPHPALIPRIVSDIGPGPSLLRIWDFLVGALRAAGIEDDSVPAAFALVASVINGFVMRGPSLAGADDEAAADAVAVIDFRRLSPTEFPNLVAVGNPFATADRDQDLETAMRLALDGLELGLSNASGKRPRRRASATDAPPISRARSESSS